MENAFVMLVSTQDLKIWPIPKFMPDTNIAIWPDMMETILILPIWWAETIHIADSDTKNLQSMRVSIPKSQTVLLPFFKSYFLLVSFLFLLQY